MAGFFTLLSLIGLCGIVAWQGLNYIQKKKIAAADAMMRDKFAGMIDASQYPTISGAELHYIKRAFDEMLSEKIQGGMLADAKVIRDRRTELINWIESKNSAYKNARQTYIEQSNVITRMIIGKQLEYALTGSDFGHDTIPLLPDHSPSYEDAIAAIKDKLISSTGLPYGPELEQLMTSNDFKVVDDVWRSMSIEFREKELASLASGQTDEGIRELRAQLKAVENVVTESWLYAYEQRHNIVPEGNSERNPGHGPIDFVEWQNWKRECFERTGSLWVNHVDGLPPTLRDNLAAS